MSRNVSKHPTDLELEVLQILWDSGPLTGQAIRDELAATRPLTYQSVMTVLGIMEEKGYVTRKKVGGRFQYRARVTQQATSKRMMRDLVDRLFGGSAAVAMINLLESSELNDQELEQLRKQVQLARGKVKGQ
jgi:predicted transcriptional regulator